jgi:hypothetical protein
MPAPIWLGYVGPTCGVIGLIVSIISYRRISKIKALDLRLELRTLRNQTYLTLNELPDLIRYAQGQRCETASFVGLMGSGWIERAKEEAAKDLHTVQQLKHQRSSSTEDESRLDPHALAARLIEERGIHATVTRCAEKYAGWLKHDLEMSREERVRRERERESGFR